MKTILIPKKWVFDQKCENERLYAKFRSRFKLDKVTKILTLENDGIIQIVLPRNKVSHYLRITHDQSGHFGESRVTDFSKILGGPVKKPIYLTMSHLAHFVNRERAVICSVIKYR